MAKRRCPVCSTPLSSYNPGPFCYAHTPGQAVFTAVSKCSCAAFCKDEFSVSLPDTIDPSNVHFLSYFIPGSVQYNDLVFSWHYRGKIGKDHKLQESKV